MDNSNPTTLPKTDDQELAQMLANLGKSSQTTAPAAAPVAAPAPKNEKREEPKAAAPTSKPAAPATVGGNNDLESLKKQTLQDLDPLAQNINLPADEKFDVLLLIIRTTDDKNLLSYAHEIAVKIEDADKKAQALLDIVKEIDYFTTTK